MGTKTFKGEEGLEQELASDWARSPGPFLLLSKVRDVNRRRQQGIPSPKPHGGKNPCPFISRQSREEIMGSPCSVHERDSGLSIFESLATRRILILKSYAEIRSRCKCGQRRNCHLGNPPLHTHLPAEAAFLHLLRGICHSLSWHLTDAYVLWCLENPS